MLVKELMRRRTFTVNPGSDYKTTLGVMYQHGLKHLAVVNDNVELVGLVSQEELVAAGTRYLQCPVSIGEIMQREVVTTTADTRVERAVMLMLDHNIDTLPVIERNRKVCGLLTETDVLRTFIELAPLEETVSRLHRAPPTRRYRRPVRLSGRRTDRIGTSTKSLV